MSLNANSSEIIQIRGIIASLNRERAILVEDYNDYGRLIGKIEVLISNLQRVVSIVQESSVNLLANYTSSITSTNKAKRLDNASERIQADIQKLKRNLEDANKKKEEIANKGRNIDREITYYKARIAELQLREIQ